MNLIIYTKTDCPWCGDVLGFLEENRLEFEERDVSVNQEYMKEMVEKSGQDKAPTIDLDGEILADAGRDEVEKFLKVKGVITMG